MSLPYGLSSSPYPVGDAANPGIKGSLILQAALRNSQQHAGYGKPISPN
jgi:hypothetical protein